MSTKSANPTYNRRRAQRAALAKLGIEPAGRPRSGNNVSHAHNKTKRLFRKNLQTAKVLVDGKLVSVRVPASALRTLTKQQKELERKAPKRKTSGKKAATTAAAKKPVTVKPAAKPTTKKAPAKKAAPKATAKK